MALSSAERQRAYRERKAAGNPTVTKRNVTSVTKTVTKAKPEVVRARGRTKPQNDGILPSATQSQFDEAAARYATGEHWSKISESMGIDWGMFMRRGQVEGNADTWDRCQMSNRLATVKRIGEKAERCAFEGKKTKTVTEKVVTKDGDEVVTGVTVTEHVESDAAMARIALEVASPEIHGKLAGAKVQQAQGQAVNVTIVMANNRRDVDEQPEINVSGETP